MARKALVVAVTLFLTAGCTMLPERPRVPPGTHVTIEEREAWREVAAEEDEATLDALPQIWGDALNDVRRAGSFRHVAGEGPLLIPAAGLPRAAPAPGAYECRVLRLGARTPATRSLGEGGQGFCFVGVEGDQLSLTVDAGPRRIGGYLWDEKDSRRLVFLGTANPRGAPVAPYGEDRARDAIGLFERIGPFRYRLTIPSTGENRLIVVELHPAPEQ